MRTTGNVHVDTALTNVSKAFKNEALVYEDVVPVVPVKFDSGKFWSFDNEERHLRETKKAEGASAYIFSYTPSSSSSYTCFKYALKGFVSDDEMQNADDQIQPKVTMVEKLTFALQLQQEYAAASMLQSTANFTASDRSASWASSTNDIEGDVMTGVEAVRSATGFVANTIVVPAAVEAKCVTRLKAAAGGLTWDDKLKQYRLPNPWLGLRVVRPAAVYRSTQEGAATQTNADIWTDSAVVCYVSPTTPNMKDPSVAWTLRSKPFTVRRWRDDDIEGEWIEVQLKQIIKLCSTQAAYVIQNCI